jgi:hypothetical protein
MQAKNALARVDMDDVSCVLILKKKRRLLGSPFPSYIVRNSRINSGHKCVDNVGLGHVRGACAKVAYAGACTDTLRFVGRERRFRKNDRS